MDFIPIPYFGMIMALFVAPALTFGFIMYLRKKKTEVEKIKAQKEIVELEIRKEELKLAILREENRKYDKIIEADHRALLEDK